VSTLVESCSVLNPFEGMETWLLPVYAFEGPQSRSQGWTFAWRRVQLQVVNVVDMTVIHVNGIHSINVQFCTCPDAPSHGTQLMQSSLWPSTLMRSICGVETPITIGYDIACQYSRNFWKRGANLPKDIYPKIPPDQLDFYVGIMHIFGHVAKCQGPWSGHYQPGNANTPGDNIKHVWLLLNVLLYSA
jgi:hypothetical protein